MAKKSEEKKMQENFRTFLNSEEVRGAHRKGRTQLARRREVFLQEKAHTWVDGLNAKVKRYYDFNTYGAECYKRQSKCGSVNQDEDESAASS